MPRLPLRPLPSQSYLNSVLKYHRDGTLTWKHRKDWTSAQNARYAGRAAGRTSKRDKYVTVSLNGKIYSAHRLIFKMHHGRTPTRLDHRNGNRADNRIGNLREATTSLNNANRPRSSKDGLPRGVRATGSRYVAWQCGQYLGTFSTVRDALAAWRIAVLEKYNAEPSEVYACDRKRR